jgi:tetratricopeptide (TPR) repeat protein
MKNLLPFLFLLLMLVPANDLFSQEKKVLQPVEVRPPRPGGPPQKEETDQQLAAQYFRNREFDKAVVLYKKLYEEKSTSIYYSYYLYCLLELESYKDAEKLAKNQIRSFPDRPKYLVDLGYVYNESGYSGKAKKQFDLALKSIPSDRNGVQQLASAYLYRGQTDYAVRVYEKARKEMDYPFYLEEGNLYRQVRNYSMMVDAYLNSVEYDYFSITTVQSRLQNVLSDNPDEEFSEYLRTSLLKRVQKDPDKVYFSELLLWLSIQMEDFEMALIQARAIDRRLNEDGERLIELAEIAMANKDYDVAIDAYKAVLKKGNSGFLYLDAKVGLLYAHYQRTVESIDHDEGEIRDLEKEYEATLVEFGKNASTVIIMQYLAHLQAFYLDNTDAAVDLLNEAIAMPNIAPRNQATCKIELADVMLLIGDVWEAKLLYAQVEKAFRQDPLGYEARYKNARLSFYIGEYDWAKAQLDVLKAATSKLIANDALRLAMLISDNLDADSNATALSMYGRADLLLYQNKEDEALAILDSIFQLASYHPIFDETMLKKAEIRIRQKNYEAAAGLLEKLLERYPSDITADNALFLLAGLYENQLEDRDKAKDLYAQLINDYPASLYAVDARKRFRILRGDFDKRELTPEEMFLFDLQNN